MKVARCGEWRPVWLLLAVCCLGFSVSARAQTNDETFRGIVAELGDANFREKEAIAERLVNTEHSSVRAVLTALFEDRLVQRTRDTQVFIVKSNDDSLATYELIDPVSLADVEAVNPDQLQRIITNNRLRRTLRTTIARFSLSSTDASVRRDAVREIIRRLDAADVALLRGLAEEELDVDVIYEIETALALIALDDEDARVRGEAVGKLKGRLHPEVRNRLAILLESDENGRFVEADPDVRTAATEVVQRIDSLRTLYSIVETVFFGLSLGSVLVLIAMGLAITFGVMGVINMAHGELVMLGAYATYVMQLAFGHTPEDTNNWFYVAALPMAFLISALAGVMIEYFVVRHLYKRPLQTLLATWGVGLILIQFVRAGFPWKGYEIATRWLPDFLLWGGFGDNIGVRV